ncbi:MAG TPA: hypothetical protein VK629_16395 [Steroidobacteraceae bacterium]|nr:hypothetical protein [Steroidobacteraceae bacterium]
MKISALGETWLAASRDLQIRVTAPFALSVATGKTLMYDAAIRDFGSDKGMLLMSAWDSEKANAATEQGYGFSCLDGGAYDRESTIELLRDWSWAAKEPQPSWL